ncbi:unnamed protein product [Orchesella dallaii]|uniref:Tyrosinase copper-binding domain-containing protein n=1 Tax=Orchesella dallaii TaxID=48710 RepID=A0ABP1RES0_9HEXA
MVFSHCDPTRHSRSFWVLSIVLLFFSFHRSVLVSGEPFNNNDNNGFVDSNHDLIATASDNQDLLAIPSEPHPDFQSGPVTAYAFDNVAVESKNGGQGRSSSVVVVPPPQQQEQNQGTQAEESSQRMRRRKPVVTAAPVTQQSEIHPQHQQEQLHQQPQQFLPIIQQYHEPQQFYYAAPAYTAPVVPIIPQYVEEQPQIYIQDPYVLQQPQEYPVAELASGSGIGHAGFLDIYQDIVKHPYKLVTYFAKLVKQVKVPKEHYINVVSFVGVYLLTCEATTGNKPSHKEWSYHAGRRFVPALPVDQKLQLEFLKLFEGSHFNEDNSGSSSEEDFSGELAEIDELCPKGTFFYSLSPMHIEAWTQLQRLFVAQRGPAEVLSLAKDLLYQQKVHPKIWYLGLIAAAQERPDMTGFNLAFIIDAMPDLFIPAHLIKDDMERYRSLARNLIDNKKRVRRGVETIALVPRNTTHIRKMSKSVSSTSTTSSSTTTQRPIPDSASSEVSGEFIGLDGSINKKEENTPVVAVDDAKVSEYKYRQGGRGQGGQGGSHKRNRHKGGKGEQHHGKGHGKGKGKGKGHDKHEKEEKCIRVDGRVGHDNGVENRLWYWREDLMLNQHHWYWHQVNPLNATRHPDRRAELFFFMHRAFLARYNAERLSNGLHRTYSIDFQSGGIIHEGYNSHLADLASGKFWMPRPPKQPLTDLIHIDDPNFARNIIFPDVMDVYNRLLKAVKLGKMVNTNGKYLSIRHSMGIDPFANTVEATNISVNPLYYDTFGIHNSGHMIIAWNADPFYKLHAPPGVMADQAVSMRDPSFYPYHVFLDNLFEKFKATLPPYKIIGGEYPLLWRGVEIHHVELISKTSDGPNQLRTFWTDRIFPLEPGVDGSIEEVAEEDHAQVCAMHLAHEPFIFKIVVERKPCAKTKSGKGTIRIFMAPRYDEKGRRLHLKEQRRLMFQLDAFQVKLRVGKNIITRRSHDSALTKPWSTSLKDMKLMAKHPSETAEFCGCGFPQHLYIPKGTKEGMPFDLFVMATNFDEDRVQDSPKDLQFPEPCNSPYIFCGRPNRRYPDARPMGYPFDRPMFKPPIPCKPGHSFLSILCQNFNLVFHKPIDTLEHFVKKAPNMKMTVFDIKHFDHLVKNFHQQQSE